MNKLANPSEHRACFRYEKGDYPSVETSGYPRGYRWEKTLPLGEIVVITEGSVSLSYDQYFNLRIPGGKILMLPPGCHFQAQAEEDTTLFIFRLEEVLRLCESCTIEKLKYKAGGHTLPDGLYTLDVKEPIRSFLLPLERNIRNGLRCSVFLYRKVEELMILLRAYYPKEELAAFFNSILSNTSEFSHFVLSNYRRVKTVKELATLYACSISSFDKKFRKAFGKAPYKWMQERKVSLIYHEIHATYKPIKQIAEEQQFTSLPQFNDYCKKHFGMPPGKMRKSRYGNYEIQKDNSNFVKQ